MATDADERERAIAAADATCPRCGRRASRRPALLPRVRPRAADRRRRRAGACAAAGCAASAGTPATGCGSSLLTLLVAAPARPPRSRSTRAPRAARATSSRADARVTRRRANGGADDDRRRPSTRRRSRRPRSRRPTSRRRRPARERPLHWPRERERLDDRARLLPEDERPRRARSRRPRRAAQAGLRQVGILDSSRFASLQPGYFVVFTGSTARRRTPTPAVGTARAGRFRRGLLPPDRPLTQMCRAARGYGKSRSGPRSFTSTENICNSAPDRVESSRGGPMTEIFRS